MAGTEGSIRDRAFAALARWGTQAPLKVLGAVLLVVFAFGAVLPGLSVSTSRTSMVSDEDPQQQRMNAFYERFGRPDYPLFVISGGTPEDRRAVVDAISSRLERDAALEGRVFGRVKPQDIASIVLVQDPTALAQLSASLPPGVDAPAFMEAGLVGWLEGLAAQVEAGLDGDEDAAGPGPQKAAEGLDQLAEMAGVLQDVVEGKDLLDRFEGADGQWPAGHRCAGLPGHRRRRAQPAGDLRRCRKR